jgi:hypothetical protein
LGVYDLGVRVQGSGFRVQSLGLRVGDLGKLGYKFREKRRKEFGVQGLGFSV